MLIEMLPPLQWMGYVEQDPSAWHLQRNAVWRDQAKGWVLTPPKDQATTSTMFIFSFIPFCCHRKNRDGGKKKWDFSSQVLFLGIARENLDIGLL